MGIAERREREKEHLRTLIVEAARDILSAEGLGALSMRAIAERIEYSPATIYLYFKDKEELKGEVVRAGFGVMNDVVRREMIRAGRVSPVERWAAIGRAYAVFALENPAYFRVMFELPGGAEVECPEPCGEPDQNSFAEAVKLIERAMADGVFVQMDPQRVALIGWGMIHGLVSLYLAGQLKETIHSHEQFLELVNDAMQGMYTGWRIEPATELASD